jgi:hypothetical protein
VWVLLLVALRSSTGAPSGTHPDALSGDFDCEATFDLVASTLIAGCTGAVPSSAAQAKIDAALARLEDAGLVQAGELTDIAIGVCPLTRGAGIVPAPRRIYLDDGLMGASDDLVAEVIAHELEHVRQFETLGARGFKCGYVRAMLACGGCQDRRHDLEHDAYARQDRARERLALDSR